MLMKSHYLQKILFIIAILFSLTISIPLSVHAAMMSDYCIVPPYVVTDLKPNIILFIDNSASMYDLQYIDEGTLTREEAYCYDKTYRSDKSYYGYFDRKTAAGNDIIYEYDFINENFKVSALGLGGCTKVIPNTLCIDLSSTITPPPPTLNAFRATGNYLNWLITSKLDAQKGVLTGGKYCDKVCSNSNIICCTQNADCPTGGTCTDVSNFLQAESRGCVGRKFIKEAMTADFIEYTPPAPDPNISLEITFGVRGPVDDINKTRPSQGGQTYIDLFYGDYDAPKCDDAINAIEQAHSPAEIRIAVEDCLASETSAGKYCSLDPDRAIIPSCTTNSDCNAGITLGTCNKPAKKCTTGRGVCSVSTSISCTIGIDAGCPAGESCVGFSPCNKDSTCNISTYYGPCVDASQSAVVNTKIEFNLSMQECWQYWSKGTPPAHDAFVADSKKCAEIYAGYKICNNGPKDGLICSVNADCPAGTCIQGPTAIRAGNPGYLCNSSFAGYCNGGSAADWDVWIPKPGYATGEECFLAKYLEYCAGVDFPPVTDPTDIPSETGEYGNLPAIIADISVEAQLGQPIRTLTVKLRYDGYCAIASATPCATDANCPTGDHCKPYGLLQEFDGQVRFGMMTFNYNGSATECNDLTSFKCPKICEVSTNITCTTNLDCPFTNPPLNTIHENCISTIKNNTNKDAGMIQSHIKSICSGNLAVCTLDSDCPDGEVCRPYNGNHNTGLIYDIDKVRATAWTPYAEGFFNAIAYFTQKTTAGAVPYRLYSSDFRLTSDVPSEPNPIQGICQDNNVVLISDGMSTTDQNTTVMTFVNANHIAGGQITTAPSAAWDVAPRYFGSKNLDDLAYYGQNAALTNPVSATKNIRPIMTSVLYSGSECDAKAADKITCTTTDEGVPEKLMQLTAYYGGGIYKLVHDPEQFRTALYDILQALLKRASAGAAASVLASGEGSGANIVQAVFYPKRKFSLVSASGVSVSNEIRWTGRISNFWYYVDPFFKASSIYEDNASSKVLDLRNDNKITFYYDPALEQTMATRARDTNNDGKADTILGSVPFETLTTLWEGGLELWKRDLSVTPRKIYTTINGTDMLVNDFSTANAGALLSYLNPPDYDSSGVIDAADASILIRYMHGEDFPALGLRSRTVPVDLNGNGQWDAGESKVWKLGDILNSTPRISSWIPLNQYHDTYMDTSYVKFVNDPVYGYKNREMVFAGGNDGMIHAFKLGSLELSWLGQNEYEKARMLPLAGTDFGKEIWAFIPKNVLPYLKYMPELTYCHIYTVDLNPFVFDASIGAKAAGDISAAARPNDGSTWRTVLIGGLQYGGGCKDPTDSDSNGVADSCTSDTNGDGVVTNDDCVLTPVSGKGYSSYFALDITDQNNPVLLWEFSNSGLGFSTTGPAIVRVGDRAKNGKWVVVIGSGPTGPIEKKTHQFMGNSDQNLQLFLLDLKTGSLLRTIDTKIENAFAGTLADATFDSDVDYQDDIVYIGYTKKSAAGEWTDGGVLRLMTKEDTTVGNWKESIVLDNVGAVTTSVTRLQNNKTHELWLFFGTGRYYFEIEDKVDDADTRRRLFAVKDPCFTGANIINTGCTLPVSGTITDVTDTADALPEDIGEGGWYINLEGSGPYQYNERGSLVTRNYRAERVVSDPLAASTGLVFYSTFKPYNELCAYGGKSFTWAVRYDTGGAAGILLRGIALVQVSTGSIEQMSLPEAFKQDALKNPDSKGDRRGPAIEGKMGGNIRLMSTPPPVKRVIHTRER